MPRQTDQLNSGNFSVSCTSLAKASRSYTSQCEFSRRSKTSDLPHANTIDLKCKTIGEDLLASTQLFLFG